MLLVATIYADVHQSMMNIQDVHTRVTRRVLIVQWLGFRVMLQTLERDTIPDLINVSASIFLMPRYVATVSQSTRPPSDRH